MNRTIGILFSALVIASVAFAFSERPDPPMPESAIRIHQLLMLDAVVVGDRLVAVGERGHVFVSDDDGGTWRSAQSDTESTLTALTVGEGDRLVAVGHDSVILLSEDRGEQWRKVFAAPEALEPLLAVWFDGGGQGFAVGAYGRFLESADGGLSWRQRYLNGSDLHLNALGRAGEALLIAGEAGTLLRSHDGGQEWFPLDSPYVGSFFGLLELRDGAVLVFGMRGHVYRSEDSGDTWTEVETGTHRSIFGGRVLEDDLVVLAGQNGLVLVSQDQGRSFAEADEEISRTFSHVIGSGRSGEVLLLGEKGLLRFALDVGPGFRP